MKELTEIDYKYYIYRYIQEVAEGFIAYTLYNFFLVGKVVDYSKVIKISLFIGLVTLILEEYNPKYSNSLKTGIFASLGGHLIKSE